MADMLATVSDLANLMQIPVADVDTTQATVLLEAVTAVVQEAASNQRLVYVADDTAKLIGGPQPLLFLPQRPVTAVTSVVVDGTTLTEGDDYKLLGTHVLRRACGWQTTAPGQSAYLLGSAYLPGLVAPGWVEPTNVVVTYSHGYQPGDQDLQLARAAVLSVASTVWDNPGGASQIRIDDYSAVYDAASAAMEARPGLRRSLRRKYGLRAGFVQVGR